MKKPTRVERKRRRQRILFRLLLLVMIITMSTTYLLKSDFLAIKNINIYGNSHIPSDEIISISRINIGDNILRIKKTAVEKDINSISYIKNVEVKRKLPSTININVEERKPVLQIKSLSSYFIIDMEGFVVDIMNDKFEDIPTFEGFYIDNMQKGENLLDNDKNQIFEDFLNDVELQNVLKEIFQLEVDTEGEINIKLNNGINVAFGPIYNVKYKLRYLERIILDIEKNQLSVNMILMNKGENPIIVTE